MSTSGAAPVEEEAAALAFRRLDEREAVGAGEVGVVVVGACVAAAGVRGVTPPFEELLLVSLPAGTGGG
jgi:hypothetical protein